MNGITASLALTLATMGLKSASDVAYDEVDLVEINHYFDEHGRLVFDQVIYYDWSTHDARYQVCAWRLLKHPAQVPHRHWDRDVYVSTWHDGNVLRTIYAKALRETWTQYDPELVERDYLPKECRRELHKPRPGLKR